MARKSILKRERRELRAWYIQQQPRPSHRECITWFEEKFHQKLTQGTISKSLSHRYSHLDDYNASSIAENGCRTRTSKWPILEKLLFEWQQSVEAQRDGSASVTSDALVAKAMEIWPQIPEYRDQPQPLFSSGWLTNYKTRYNSKTQQQSQHQQSHIEANQLNTASTNNEVIMARDLPTLSFDVANSSLSNPTLDTPCSRRAPEIRVPTPHEALKGLQTYLMFKACQEDSKPIELRSLILQEQQLQLHIENTTKQSTLDSWLVGS
ncbi:putative centromere binding protein cbh2 [Erysiphe necator]|uniref:Putative centromere binding protein cbh2 n=1 Tax=Uncinula necator TaxID=52586 RepID=A0A0B1P0H1_UNCNE|nr:putative centromere binding protein cbh2 [Erysiphe necator]